MECKIQKGRLWSVMSRGECKETDNEKNKGFTERCRGGKLVGNTYELFKAVEEERVTVGRDGLRWLWEE